MGRALSPAAARTLWASLLLLALAAPAAAQAQAEPPVPGRQLPPEVLAGVQLVEDRFEAALAGDCDPERCFAQGCTYTSHTVVDRPAASSLPGLGRVPGPSGGPKQIFLTEVACGFAHERSVKARDAKALGKRLSAKLSKAWTRVTVTPERLDPLPDFLSEPPEPEPEPDAAVDLGPPAAPDAGVVPPSAPSWDAPIAGRELWLSVLPHFPWMFGVLLVTFAALLLIWAARRLGRLSPEAQALLAQIGPEAPAADDAAADPAPAEDAPDADAASAARLAAQRQAWRDRLAQDDVAADRALQVLVADLLRTGERRMLAKAVIVFPEAFPNAFPQGGAFASAKFELAEYIKHADPATLPSDQELFDTLDRYAMSAALTAHPDTELIRSLHDDFGTAALVDTVRRLPPRFGALLFAVAPEPMQREAARQLDARSVAGAVDQLLQSNRMDPTETDHLLTVLGALRAGEPIPAPPATQPVTDRGAAFDAPAALSVLLPQLAADLRTGLVNAAVARGAGALPAWTHDTLYAEMLLALDDETLGDLLLEVSIEPLAAWLRVQTEASADALRARLPAALRAALSATAPPTAPGPLFALANDARVALSAGLNARLARRDVPFHHLLA